MSKQAIQQMKLSMRLPVIMAPMFLVSSPKMVVAACRAGIAGTFPALNARTSDILEDWMHQINTEIDVLKEKEPTRKIAPWGINFITHRSNKRYTEDLKLIEKYQPPIVITSLGDPSPVVEIAHQYGGVVFSDVINVKFAKKAIEKGADGLVLVASGAGGHAGVLNPIPFIHEVRSFFDGPIVLAGGMSEGEDILASEILGADFVYMGTRFIPSEESGAPDAYKQMIVESSIEDIIYTDAFSGVNANYLIPSIVKAGLDPNQLEKKQEINFEKLDNPEVKAWKDVWGSGQGIGAIDKVQSIERIVSELEESYTKATRNIVSQDNTMTQT
ncbi:MAG: NAD(P)H-dependent flavin oxidoreductase [Bacillota bacterium]|uniref:Probable nitronate monooxygenase n=2 Tax=Bacillati TaxID=1783272 RepID=A0A941DS00_9BACI|nr:MULTISPECIES: nitronate monooxygenase [Virgibacillus]NAZ08740.1 nitronate monooxygenase [Agaribacter marinus]MBR7796029.1 nitronate monooxygenase [Virgibacillus salarius]MCC2248549.1 nitronate monooxygenase [Virgibacillus sp. AGTR]MDY7043249.1 nitronate monooxygenase [Virgibacillus sp. M23]QRZ18271.1 nitronate monooxygenase [Virgibacillus sp. AGTR]